MSRKNNADRQSTYDKFVRQTIRTMALPMMQNVFGLPNAVNYQPLDTKIVRSYERIPDIWGTMTLADGDSRILHVEVQTENDPKMSIRMTEYGVLALK